jgi:hypothetical protein
MVLRDWMAEERRSVVLGVCVEWMKESETTPCAADKREGFPGIGFPSKDGLWYESILKIGMSEHGSEPGPGESS